MEFNALKTVSVLFTKNIKYTNPKIYLNSAQIKISKSMLYLGVNLDSKLDWNLQINYLKTKAIQLIMNITSFAKHKYGLNRRSLEVIYKGAIIPIISYGSPVWFKALDRKQNQKIFESIQRLLALRFSSAYKTVSTEALNIIANLMPIELRIKQIATEFHLKKNIKSDLVNYYFDTNVDLNLISRPIDLKKIPHPGVSYKILG